MSAPGIAAEQAQKGRIIRQGAFFWTIIALLNAASQIALSRQLQPGEFGAVNTVLGVAAVLSAPLIALALVFIPRPRVAEDAARWLTLRPVLMETAALIWGVVSLLLLFVLLPWLALPVFSLDYFAILVVGVSLATVVGNTVCAALGRARLWIGLALGAAVIRLACSAGLAHFEPWAQSGLAAVIVAGIAPAIPALQPRSGTATRAQAWSLFCGRNFLVPYLAAFSVMLAIALFTNADRIIAQSQFGTPNLAQMGYVDLRAFDNYQVAGLLGRSLLWGTLPLLLIFRASRMAQARTPLAASRIFGLYLGLLIAGVMLLVFLAPMLSEIFTGDPAGAAGLIPGFAAAMFMIGLVQGVGIFALASRRHPECFTLGLCSIGYVIFLYRYGHQPEIMTSCMFGGALISLMAVLIVGVIRYARTHP